LKVSYVFFFVSRNLYFSYALRYSSFMILLITQSQKNKMHKSRQGFLYIKLQKKIIFSARKFVEFPG